MTVYDTLGQLRSVKNANNELTAYEYDMLGSLKQTTFPDGKTKINTYDEIGRLIKTTDAKNKIEKLYYDAVGNQTKLLDRNGNRFKYSFDNRNLLKKKEITDSSWNVLPLEEVITFNYNLAGQLTQMIDNTGTTNYSYNIFNGLLKTMTYPDGRSISYGYDASGKRSVMIDPFGYNTYYHYDAQNRLDIVAPSNDFISNPNTNDFDAKYQYYNNGLLKQITQKNGVTSNYGYDGKKISSLVEKKSDGTIINSFTYSLYDSNGNLKKKTENGITSDFTYDKLNRISTSTQFNETYEYDVRGNRKSLSTNHPFDRPDSTTTYDKRDRLTKVELTSSGSVFYKYNGNGQLWERTENGQTTRYYWDGDQIIAEAIVNGDGVSTLKARYIRGHGLVAREDFNGKAYYLKNGHGDVVNLMNGTGKTSLNSYSYDIFGNTVSQKESIQQPFMYSGELTDSTTGLQYLRARWYDPTIGRFINEDTYEGQISNPLSLNLYTYVENNPLLYFDPSGHKKASDNEIIDALVQPFTDQWNSSHSNLMKCTSMQCATYYSNQQSEAEKAADAVRVSYYVCNSAGYCGSRANIPGDIKYRTDSYDMYLESKYGNVRELSIWEDPIAMIVFAVATDGTMLAFSKSGQVALQSGQKFYQVTSNAAAEEIIKTGVLTGSKQEAGQGFVWTTRPTLSQAKNSGARSLETVIEFQVPTGVVGIDRTVAANLQSIARVANGPLKITDVKVVGFK